RGEDAILESRSLGAARHANHSVCRCRVDPCPPAPCRERRQISDAECGDGEAERGGDEQEGHGHQPLKETIFLRRPEPTAIIATPIPTSMWPVDECRRGWR